MEFGRGAGKAARGMAKEGNMGEDPRSRVWRDVCWRSDGDPRGEGGLGRWSVGRWEVEVEIEFRGFEFRSREGGTSMSDVEYVEYSLGRWAGM